jgi:hypothetical protein
MFDYNDSIDIETPTKKIKLEKKSNKNKKYLIEIKEYHDYLNIKITAEEKIPYREYEKNVYLSDIVKNKFLSNCTSISEVLVSLESKLKNSNTINLTEEENILYLKIESPNPLVNEMIFSIPKIKKEKNAEIKDLIYIINKQQKMINKLNERVLYLEEKEREREKEKIEKNLYLYKNSKIIPGDKEKEYAIRQWINPNKKFFKAKLLFRMSVDGKHSSTYHKVCDNKDNLLTLIETDNNIKFGGFASKSWGVENQCIKEAFMFSLNQMKKFERLNFNNSKWDGSDYGPVFGNGWDVYINSEMTTGRERYNSDSVFFKKFEITNNGYFSVKEIEVYQIE